MVQLNVNGQSKTVDMDEETPILWAVREQLGLTGTKFGCGAALCGACTIHIDGEPVRSCVTPIADAEGKEITTIEGIAAEDGTLHAVQKAWIAHQVPQCGYCQSGQVMSAVALLKETPNPTDADIDVAMAGNVCRCGMYTRIKAAIKTAAKEA
ncbi:MAG: (2Fe-2S)-binding protein [Maricaulaceae bacterium]